MSTLPPGWSLAPFTEVISIDSDLVDPGLSPDAAHIAPNHIESGTGRLLPFTTVAEDGVTSAKHRFHPGQILYSKIRPYLAKAALVDFEGLCSADMYPMSTALEPRFVHRWLLSDAFTQRVSQDQGRTVLPKVNQAALNKVMVPVPPIAEQRRIADKIERSLARSRRAKEALDAVPPLLDKLRQSILAAAFRGDLTADWRAKNPNVEPADQLLARIRTERRARWEAAELAKMQAKGKVPSDDRWNARYPEPDEPNTTGAWEVPPGWSWVSLDTLIEKIEAGASFSCDERRPLVDEVGVLKVSAVTWGEYNESESKTCIALDRVKPEFFVRPGDFLFSRANTIDLVGACVIARSVTRRLMLSDKILRIKFINIPQEWLLFVLRSYWGRREIERLATGNQESMRNIGQDRIRQIRVPVPPLDEMRIALRRVERALQSVSALASVVGPAEARLAKLDQSILAKAFRGELVPQDPTDEPASALLDRIRSTREATPPRKPHRARKASAEAPAPEPAPPPVEPTASTLAAEVFPALWPRGPLDKDTAVRTLAEHLRTKGAVEFKRLRADGPLYAQLLAAIESAVKSGELDRPRRAHVRAIKLDATAYTSDDWRQVLLASLGPEPIHQEDAIRHAAEWARDNLGLEFTRLRADGHIATGLRSAITSAIRQRLIERDGPKRIVLPRG